MCGKMIKSILQHDLRLTLCNRKTWYYLAIMQVILSLIFNWLLRNFLRQQALANASLYGITEEIVHPYYAAFALFVLLMIPAISTQSICAERQRLTIVNLQCASLTPMQIILSKYLVLNILLLTTCLIISIMPLTICISGSLDWGQLLSAILGLYLMLSAALAVGLVVSTFMGNIVRCNMLILFTLAGFVLIEWAAQYTGRYAFFLQGYGLLNPLKSFLSGILNLQFISYYILIIYSSILLSSWRFARRWSDD